MCGIGCLLLRNASRVSMATSAHFGAWFWFCVLCIAAILQVIFVGPSANMVLMDSAFV